MYLDTFIAGTVVLMAVDSIFGQVPDAAVNAMIKADIAAVQKLSVEQPPSVLMETFSKLSEKYDELGPHAYVTAMISLIDTVQQSEVRNDAVVRALLVEIAKKTMDKDKKEVIVTDARFRDRHFSVFFDLLGRIDRSSADFAKERALRASYLLKKWQDLLISIDELSTFDPKKGFALEPYDPPSSYRGFFVFGMKPEAITDPKVRQDYAQYLRKRDEFLISSVQLKQLRAVRKRYEETVVRFLADAYGAKEADRAEMKCLVEKHIKDKADAKDLIRAVEDAVARPSAESNE